MIVLGLSTSSARGSVSVLRESTLLAHIVYDGGTSHAETIFSVLDRSLAAAGVTTSGLDAIACDVGPGSFTGVRVAVAASQGIALALAIPAVGVQSLAAMAFAARARQAGRSVLAVLDARKGEVFAALFDVRGTCVWGPTHRPSAEPDDLIALVAQHDALVVGEMGSRVPGLPDPVRGDDLDLPDAAMVARAAGVMLAAHPPAAFDAALLEPVYVRAPDARPMVTSVPKPPSGE